MTKHSMVKCKKCQEDLAETDGQFIYFANRRVNPDLKKQNLRCPKCQTITVWKREDKFNPE